MDIDKIRRCGPARAGFAVILVGLAGGCAEQSQPAPVFLRGSAEPVIAPMPAPPPALQVIVKRGQTLDGFAYTYHMPKSALIAANGLRPPYVLREGQRLTIPNLNAPARPAPAASVPRMAQAAPPPPVTPAAAMAPAPVPQPPPSPQTITVPQRTTASGAVPPQTIFSAQQQAEAARTQPTPQPAAPPAQMAAAPQQSVTPPPSAAKVLPEIIPLDGPPPGKEAAAPPQDAAQINAQASGAPAVLPPRNPAAATPLPGEDPAQTASAAAAPATAAAGGGRFPWPVRGRILAGYGNTPGGGHNDGINIAAPRGTPVRAIEGGTVAYAGNEVKGYGNIVLIKHPDGWISAYAHLDDVTVKPGDTIAAGEVIAKVGESGGVGEPQLHFELRRGKKPVNPTEFLAPAPSAATPAGNGAG